MDFFYKYFGADNHVSDQNEMHVTCPFPHKSEQGGIYYEQNPSAHINLDKNVFHCKSCGRSSSETAFMANINNISYGQAARILGEAVDDNWTQMEENLEKSPKALELVNALGLESVRKELRIGFQGSGITFPVFMNNILLSTCTYNPESTPKTRLSKGAKSLIFPYDLWDKEKPTLLCAGFKDASIARVHGFNAITFTHGEMSFPKLFKRSFSGCDVFISYDNDEAGRKGAMKAATFIKEAGGSPYIVDLSSVCAEKGEDIHDFFKKYKKDANDLQNLIDQAESFTDEEYETEREKIYPLVKLEQATEGRYHNRVVSSRSTVIAKWEQAYQVPDVVEMEKVIQPGDNCLMHHGEKVTWTLEENNLKDLLYLCDSNLKDDQIQKHIKQLAGVPVKERGVAFRPKSWVNVFKAIIMDDNVSEVVDEMGDGAYKPAELTVYSIEQSLASGEKVKVFYKPVPHPLQAQMVVGLVTRIEESDTAIRNFKVTDEVIKSLECFQVQDGETVKTKMNDLAQRVKAIAGPETIPQLAWSVDLYYHTPLQFKWGERVERAYLDTMIVGESRTGKSQTAKKLLELYQLGVFTSLKTTTKAGLIGGSDQTQGGYKTKLGVIPRNHRGAVIMEEFSGASKEMISQLTDIRSSNMVRLARVNGDTQAPAMVRMLSISNQRKEGSGETIPLRQQSSGIDVVVKLIGAAEDVGRYDFFLLVDKPEEYTSPNLEVGVEPYAKEAYLNRIRWIWSRSPDQIILSKEVRDYIANIAEKLNREYDCHINFFGPEAWKKLTRLAIATAANVCSIDETGEKLLVKVEHVDWARNFLVACYDNDLFNLRMYVDDERAYSHCPPASVTALQGIYNQNKTLVLQLEKGTEFSQSQLKAFAGLDNKEFNEVFSRLAESYFVRYSRSGEKVIPSERFRKALKKIKKNEYMKKVGAEY